MAKSKKPETRFVQDSATGIELVVSRGDENRHPAHTHVSTVAFLLVRKGAVVLQDRDGERSLERKKTAVILPDSLYRLRFLSPSEMICLCLARALFDQGALTGGSRRFGYFLTLLSAPDGCALRKGAS